MVGFNSIRAIIGHFLLPILIKVQTFNFHSPPLISLKKLFSEHFRLHFVYQPSDDLFLDLLLHLGDGLPSVGPESVGN